MITSRQVIVIVGMTLALFVLTGCTLATLWTGASGPPIEGQYVYFEDFSAYDLGSHPTSDDGWQIDNGDGEFGTVTIVADPGTSSGKALRILSRDDVGGNEQFNTWATKWTAIDTDVETVQIEFSVRWVQGTGMNIYINSGNDKIIMGLGNGILTYNDSGSFNPVTELGHEWNYIRVVANRVQDQVLLYVNEEPMGTFSLRNPASSWSDARFRFLVVSAPNQTREILFGDLKVSTIDDE